MTRLLACLLIHGQALLQLGDRGIGADENGMSHLPNQTKSLGTGQGHADGWVGLLIWPGDYCDVVEIKMVASVGKLLLRPGLGDNVERFQKTAAASAYGTL